MLIDSLLSILYSPLLNPGSPNSFPHNFPNSSPHSFSSQSYFCRIFSVISSSDIVNPPSIHSSLILSLSSLYFPLKATAAKWSFVSGNMGRWKDARSSPQLSIAPFLLRVRVSAAISRSSWNFAGRALYSCRLIGIRDVAMVRDTVLWDTYLG